MKEGKTLRNRGKGVGGSLKKAEFLMSQRPEKAPIDKIECEFRREN